MSFSLLDRLLELETAVSYTTFAPSGTRPYTYKPGAQPILISAPHATAHTRGQRIKKEEGFTGALAHLLAEETGAHALYSRYRSPDDPNWDRRSPYKQYLQEIVQTQGIQFVLDLHGMSNRHKIGLALGSMNGRSCPNHEPFIRQTIAQQFWETTQVAAQKFSELRWDHFVLNHSRFTGGLANHTVTRFASQQLGVPAMQIELCAAVRVVTKRSSNHHPTSPHSQPEAVARTVMLLQTLVNALAATM